jgi:hypothetical protein
MLHMCDGDTGLIFHSESEQNGTHEDGFEDIKIDKVLLRKNNTSMT